MNTVKSLKISKENLTKLMLGSSVIGVGISYGDYYLFHLILSILGIVWVYQLKENRYKLNINSFSQNHIFFLFIMFFWYSVSLMWAPDTQLALKYVFYIFCGLTITLSIIYFSITINKLNDLYKFLSVFFIIELLVALAESFTSFRMPISSYSKYASYFGKEPVDFFSYDNVFFYSDFTPPTGFHWNTNNLAISMIIICFI